MKKISKIIIVAAIALLFVWHFSNERKVAALSLGCDVTLCNRGAQIRTIDDGYQGIRIINSVLSKSADISEIHYGLLLANFTKNNTATSISQWTYDNVGSYGIKAFEVNELDSFGGFADSYAVTIYGFTQEQYNIDLRFRPYARYKLSGDETEYIAYGDVSNSEGTSGQFFGDKSIAEVAVNAYDNEPEARLNEFISGIVDYVRSNYSSTHSATFLDSGKRTYTQNGYSFEERLPIINNDNGFILNEEDSIEPTCEDDGKTIYHSDIYGDVVFAIDHLGHDFDEDGNCRLCDDIDVVYELSADETSYIVKNGTGFSGTTLIIPSTHKGLPVTEISGKAFENCSNLQTITIPSSVESIGDYAFDNCLNIQTLNLEKCCGVISHIFSSSDNDESYLVFVDYDAWVPNKLTTINITGGTEVPDDAFAGMREVTNVSISDDVKILGDSCFCLCESITKLDLPSDLEEIGSYAFYDTCLSSLVIPNTVTSIGESALPNSITELSMPSLPLCLGEIFGFRSYEEKLNILRITSGTTIYTNFALFFDSLRTVILCKSITTINSGAFYFDNPDVMLNIDLYRPKEQIIFEENWCNFALQNHIHFSAPLV